MSIERRNRSPAKYLRLARITSWPPYSLAFVIPFAVGAYSGTSWGSALIGFSSLLLFAGFAFALNFYSDRDTDIYHDGIQKDFNLGQQPMVTGEVSEKECKVFCYITLVSAIGLGFLVSNLFAVLVILACLFGGILYSHPQIRLKAKPVGDVLCISYLGVLVPSAGYVLGAGILPTPLMMLLWFLVTASGYIASVMSDYEFDRRAGLKTSAVFFGQSGSMKIMIVGCLLSLIVAAFIFIADYPYPVGTRYFAVGMSTALIVLIAVIWRVLKPPRMHMPVLSSRGHYVFPAMGIVSLLFIIYTAIKLSVPDLLPLDPFSIY